MSPVQAISLFRKMMEDMNLYYPVSKNKEEELEVLSASVNPVRLKNNPVKLDDDSIKGLYEIIIM